MDVQRMGSSAEYTRLGSCAGYTMGAWSQVLDIHVLSGGSSNRYTTDGIWCWIYHGWDQVLDMHVPRVGSGAGYSTGGQVLGIPRVESGSGYTKGGVWCWIYQGWDQLLDILPVGSRARYTKGLLNMSSSGYTKDGIKCWIYHGWDQVLDIPRVGSGAGYTTGGFGYWVYHGCNHGAGYTKCAVQRHYLHCYMYIYILCTRMNKKSLHFWLYFDDPMLDRLHFTSSG
jgi:hypothetical protein